MEQATLDSILQKLTVVVDKVQNLETKLDFLNERINSPSPAEISSNVVTSNAPEAPDTDGTTNTKQRIRLLPSQTLPNSNSWNPSHATALQYIFPWLTIDTLKNIRSVSSTWNAEAAPYLADKTQLNVEKDDDDPFYGVYTILDAALNGVCVFRNMGFNKEALDGPGWECRLLLREFGPNLTSVSLETPSRSILRDILVDHCPNLEELTIRCTGNYDSDDEQFIITPDLKLKLKALNVEQIYSYRDCSALTVPLIEIVRASKDLVRISMNDSYISNNFWKGIAPYVERTKGLRKLDLKICGEGDLFEGILDLQFQNLKELNLRSKHALVTGLIIKIAGTLETLTLGVPRGVYFNSSFDTDDDDDNDDDDEDNRFERDKEMFPDMQFPELAKLKVFRLKSRIEYTSNIKSIQCLDKMRNLRILEINIGNGQLDMAILQSELIAPLPNLRQFTFVGTISSILSFQILANIFPNLSILDISLCHRIRGVRPDDLTTYLSGVVSKIALMRRLVKFCLNFDWGRCDDIKVVLAPLKDLGSLRFLEIGNYDSGVEVVDGVEPALAQLRQLECIRLKNFVVRLSEAKKLFQLPINMTLDVGNESDP